MYKRAKKSKNAAGLMKCRKFEKDIRREIQNSIKTKIRSEVKLGPNNLWKAVNLALNKYVITMPEIVTEDGDVLCDDKQKADTFADYFEKKVHNIASNTTIQESVYNGRKKIFGSNEDDWISEDKVSKIIDGLSSKRCEG